MILRTLTWLEKFSIAFRTGSSFKSIPLITTKIDDNVDISRSKLENTSIIFLQLQLSNREPFFKKNFS